MSPSTCPEIFSRPEHRESTFISHLWFCWY